MRQQTMQRVGMWLVALLMLALTTAPFALAQTPVTTCGQILGVAGSYYLPGDLNCTSSGNGAAVMITANNVTFSLDHHTISGSGGSVEFGIFIQGQLPPGASISGVSVVNGTVTGFGVGAGIVLFAVEGSTVNHMTVTQNGTGIVALQGTQNNQLNINVVSNNSNAGISTASQYGNYIVGNNITGNGNTIVAGDPSACPTYNAAGIFLGSLSGDTAIANTVSGNSCGVLVRGSGDLIGLNTVTGNGAYGIFVSGGDNVILGNTASGNPSDDAFDNNPSCDSNTWLLNSFGTKNQSCIK